MEPGFREILAFHGGNLVLTPTHLLMTDPNHVVSASYELAQIADIGMEEHHSFRHRGWGMIAAAGLLVPSFWCLFTVIVEGNWGVLATHLGLAILFGLLFGTLFLYGVLASRRIAWLRLTCNGMEKMIPLPGIEKSQLENALGARRASKAPPW
jgi:hypothetical protein